jgi:aryl-alcohol dehydrogenase-like predicted oxidoreductase
MEYRQLGRAGVRVSVIGLGTNRLGNERIPQPVVDRMIDCAQDLGINHIDTANIYTRGQSEITLGKALKDRWQRFFLATKFRSEIGQGPNDRGASRYHMLNAVEDSLRRLQTDHIDLYYVHSYDETTPIDETLRALDDLVHQGKVRYIGASNFASWQIAYANLLAELRGWSQFVALQNEYHLFERAPEREELPYCKEHGVGFIPYFPLAGGFLTGKYRRGQPAPAGSRGESSAYVQKYMTPAKYEMLEDLTIWAAARGHGINELAHAWLLAQPGVSSVISGATRPEQIESNAQSAGWSLTPEELREVAVILGSGSEQ